MLAFLLLASSCGATTIVGPLETTTTTTSTIPATPTGDIGSLLGQLADLTDGLGQVIVDGDNTEARNRLARAEVIWEVMEPQIRAAGVDLVEEVKSIIDLLRTAVERKRPADADKAQRFVGLVQDSVETLLP